MRSVALNYDRVHASDTPLKAVDGMLSLSDEEFAATVQENKARRLGLGLSLKKYSAPFLDSKLGQLSLLNVDLQARLLEVRAQLSMFNEEVEQARAYFKMTFDKSADEINHEVAIKNLNGCYLIAAKTAQRIAKHIGKIAW